MYTFPDVEPVCCSMSRLLLRTYIVSVGWEFGCWGAFLSLFKNIYSFVYLVCAVCLNCSTLGLLPRPGTEARPPALGAWSPSPWTTREVPDACLLASVIPASPALHSPVLAQAFLLHINLLGSRWERVHCSPSTSKAHSVFQDSLLSAFSFPTSTSCGSAVPHSRLCLVTHLWPGLRCGCFSSPLPHPVSLLQLWLLQSHPAATLSLKLTMKRGALPECGSRFQLEVQSS